MSYVLMEAAISIAGVAAGAASVPLLPHPDDAQFVASTVAGLIAFRTLMPLLSGALFDLVDPTYTPDERRSARKKHGSHVNKFIMHVVLLLWGVQEIYAQQWFATWLDADGFCFDGWNPSAFDCPYRLYYLTQLSFFVSSSIMAFFEPQSHDHVAMLAHHIGSACLITFSYVNNLHRIGLMVLVARDAADILIHAARMLVLVHLKTAAEAILVLFIMTWILTRNFHHTFVILPAAALCRQVTDWNAGMHGVFVVLLGLLVPLDAYYLYLALEAVLRRIRQPSLKNIDPDSPLQGRKKSV